MAGLLVSVRDVPEALTAWNAGATLVDVKEPRRGPLGPADAATVRAIRAALPVEAAVSLALGELADWDGSNGTHRLPGIAYRKLGLAGSDPDWVASWRKVIKSQGDPRTWVAVIYADWWQAAAPDPQSVLDEATRCCCGGVLIDTWNKRVVSPLRASSPWIHLATETRRHGLFLALAGGLDEKAIVELAPLRPDLFAVRGAACSAGDRLARIDPRRVARLVELAAEIEPSRDERATPRFSRTTRSAR